MRSTASVLSLLGQLNKPKLEVGPAQQETKQEELENKSTCNSSHQIASAHSTSSGNESVTTKR